MPHKKIKSTRYRAKYGPILNEGQYSDLLAAAEKVGVKVTFDEHHTTAVVEFTDKAQIKEFEAILRGEH